MWCRADCSDKPLLNLHRAVTAGPCRDFGARIARRATPRSFNIRALCLDLPWALDKGSSANPQAPVRLSQQRILLASFGSPQRVSFQQVMNEKKTTRIVGSQGPFPLLTWILLAPAVG